MYTRGSDLPAVVPRPPFGAILLAVLLGAALLTLGEKAFRDLRGIPTRPTASRNQDDLQSRTLLAQTSAVRDSLSALGEQLRTAAEARHRLEEAYNTEREAYRVLLEFRSSRGLTEEALTAQEKATEESLRMRMDSLRVAWDAASDHYRKIEMVGDAIDARLVSLSERLRDRQRTIERQYRNAMRAYETKVAALRFLVIGPFFLLTLLAYQSTRVRHPILHPHATAALVVAVLLLLRGTGEYAWKAAQIYGAMILAVLGLGTTLILILRRHYSAARLTGLRVARGQCPSCQLQIVPVAGQMPSISFCPRCGLRILGKCSHCGSEIHMSLNHCPSCGCSEESAPQPGGH